jgi:opacity protein-like surface antigen
MNFDSGLTVLGGIGYAEANQDIDLTFSAPTPPQSGDQDISKPTYFVGVQYDLDRFAVRLAYEKYDFDTGVFREADIEETSVTFFYKL